MATKKRSRPLVGRDLNAAVRAEQALQLRIQGLSQQEIADQVGLSQPAVSRAIARALKKHRDEGVDMLRAIDGQRLEELFRVAFDQAKEGDMQAANVVVRTLERRAKLHGLDTGPNGGEPVYYSKIIIIHEHEPRPNPWIDAPAQLAIVPTADSSPWDEDDLAV